MDSLVVIMVVGIIIVGIVLLIVMSMTRKGLPTLDVEKYRSRWLKIEGSTLDDEASAHLAILNADKLLDSALKDRGFAGTTMADRMKNARTTFKNNDAVWLAHKLRNKIAHEQDVNIKTKTICHALGVYKKALKDLGAL